MDYLNLSKLASFLNLDYKTENTIWLTSSYTLRKTIGILGMALPFLLYLFMYIANGYTKPLESISHYYYTRVSGIFVSIMSVMAIFLIIYKGKERIDFFVSLLAGIFALLVVFFPTGNISDIAKICSVTNLPEDEFRKNFHYISAGIFLGCLAFMSIFIFTKSDKSPEKRGTRKIVRNRIYKICGIIMLLAIAIVFLEEIFDLIPENPYKDNQLIFWMEVLAVESFGFSWLIKGKTIFKDQ